MPAGYAFAVLPLISPMTRSSAFMNVAADTEMNSGLCTAAYGRFCGLGSCANAIAEPNSVSAARVALIANDDSPRSRRSVAQKRRTPCDLDRYNPPHQPRGPCARLSFRAL